MHPSRFLYIFLDEGGNLDFSQKGTSYFTLTALSKERPFSAYVDLIELKYNLLEGGLDLDCFHATEDRQAVRDQVFAIIQKHLAGVTVDAAIVNKRTMPSELCADRIFYPSVLGALLLRILAQTDLAKFREVIVVTDTIPIQKKRKAIEAAVKETLARELPSSVRYRITHHESKSCLDLQIADYLNWAIYRKWNLNDLRSYSLIENAVRSEFDPLTVLLSMLARMNNP